MEDFTNRDIYDMKTALINNIRYWIEHSNAQEAQRAKALYEKFFLKYADVMP